MKQDTMINFLMFNRSGYKPQSFYVLGLWLAFMLASGYAQAQATVSQQAGASQKQDSKVCNTYGLSCSPTSANLSKPDDDEKDGNGSFSTIFNMTKKGLNYASASARIGQRFLPPGSVTPSFAISGIPLGAVIERAYLWCGTSGNGAAMTISFTNPTGSTSSVPMVLVGSHTDKCWSYSGSHTYRADVTAAITGNGTYTTSGWLVDPNLIFSNDTDGATLMIIYSLSTAPYNGTMVIADGARVTSGGSISNTLNYPAPGDTPASARAFSAISDIQTNYSSLVLSGVSVPYNSGNNWWTYNTVSPTIAANQTSSSFNFSTNGGDCILWSMIGLYYQVTTCTPPNTPPANGNATVACVSQVATPTPPSITDGSGNAITPTGPVVTDSPNLLTCEGTRTYTYTYSNDCGTVNWSFVYTIERNLFTVPANGAATVACLAAATPPTAPAVTSNCGEALTPTGPVTTDSPNPLTCEGTRTYTYTYSNDCGTVNWSFVYTIERNLFTVPANGAATVACLAAATPPTAPAVTSNCGEALTPTGPVTTDSPNPLTCEGTRTYAYTYTDCEGNTAVWSFVYTIERNTFTVPDNGAATVACLAAATPPTAPAVTSNCGEALTPTGPVTTDSPNPLTCEGTRTYAYTYTDCEGNTAVWSFVYTIERNPFTVPANGAATVACLAAATAPTAPAVTSNCGEPLTPTGPVTTDSPNPLTCEGTRTYAYTYTDCEGNTAVWSFVYTIERDPFTVPANGAATVACLAAATAPTAPAVTSNCGEPLTPTGPVTTDSPNPLTCEGTRTYAYTYTDCEGNTAVWSFVYTIERNTFTVPANGAATVACLAAATPPTAPAVTSNCGEALTPTGPVTTDSPNPLTCEGTRTYAYTYTDCEGNTAVWSFVYTIERNTFTVPANGAATVACLAAATAPTAPTVTSNCGEPLTPTGPVTTDSPNPLTCEGTRTYAYTYTDCEGNTAVWSFVYTIERNTFTVPANGAATVACLAAATPPTAPAVTSNCGEPLTPTGPVTTDSPNPLTCEGTRTYAYTYTDCEGNTAVWSFVYSIERNPFTVPANGAATVNSPALAIAPALPTVTSNCGEVLTPTGSVITNSPNPLVCAGTRTYAYTYTDCEGNTATWSFVYTVIDNAPPAITCSNATVTFSGQATLTLNAANLASASDNCGIPTVVLSTSTLTCAQVGETIQVTATATDASNLTASCTSQVTVVGLPCGWSQDADGIGCAGGNSVSYNNGVFTVSSTGCYAAPPFIADEAAFAQRTICGDGSITAEVTSISGSGWAGVAIRESDAPGARKVQLLTNLSTLSRREVRYTTGGQAYPQQFASQNRYWLRLTRQGSQFVGYISADGNAWSQAFAVTITGLPNCLQAGLVVTNNLANGTVTATFGQVGVTGSSNFSAAVVPELGVDAPSPAFVVFPNPASGTLTIDFTPKAGQPAILEVYDLQGLRVRRIALDAAHGPTPLDVSNLPEGMYIFRIGDAQQRVVLQ